MVDPPILILEAASPIPQAIVTTLMIIFIIISVIFVTGLLFLLNNFVKNAPADDPPLKYGNFFVVSLGITAALIGFLAAFPLIISGVFDDPTQVLALLSALFGTIVGLVGTYFGVKASSDATKGAQDQANKATAHAVQAAQGGADNGDADNGDAGNGGAGNGGADNGDAGEDGAGEGGADKDNGGAGRGA